MPAGGKEAFLSKVTFRRESNWYSKTKQMLKDMETIEERATEFALKEIRCKSVEELENLGTELAYKAFEEIRSDYIRIATEQETIDEQFYTTEMLRKEKEEADHLREVKKMLVDKACECFELAVDWQAWANGDFEYAKSYFRKVLEEDTK